MGMEYRGAGGQRVANLASFESSVLKTPLTKACNGTWDLIKASAQMSRSITGFMGVRKSRKDEFGHVEKICRLVLRSLQVIILCECVHQAELRWTVSSFSSTI